MERLATITQETPLPTTGGPLSACQEGGIIAITGPRDTRHGRQRTRQETALVSFLCSEAGGWSNGQLIYSNGGQQ
jgi:3-oxoacyl-[acyl-carrier protein] reductase